MPLDALDLAAIGGGLSRLAELLRKARIQLPGVTRERFEAERDEILLTIDGYLEPRIGAPDAPIVAAIVGPSGVGKSTLLNSIAQLRVSAAGVVRPTTERPMVWADSSHPDDYWSDFSDRAGLHLGRRIDAFLVEHPLTEHLTVIDTPPLDRFDPGEVAAQAVAISDLCLFVTSPSRYADGLAWDFLRRTRGRGVPMLFILNRLPADLDEQDAVLDDFATRLYQRELLAEPDASLLFSIAEGEIDSHMEALEADAVSAIRKELAEVADPVYRSGLVDETVYATARMVAERARALTRPMAAEQPVVASLLDAVATSYATEAGRLDKQLAVGPLRKAEHPPRWQDVADDLAAMVTRRAGAGAHNAAANWSSRSAAAELVDIEGPELWRHAPETATDVRLALDEWRSGLESLVSRHARPGRLRWFGSRQRAVVAVWSATLRATEDLPPRLLRKLVDGDAIVEEARRELSSLLVGILEGDAARFARYLAPDSGSDLYEAIIDRADVVDARLDELAGQIPRAWTEPEDDVEVLDDLPQHPIAIEIREGSTLIELAGAEGAANGEVREEARVAGSDADVEVVLEDGS